jgi:hypothetical protein
MRPKKRFILGVYISILCIFTLKLYLYLYYFYNVIPLIKASFNDNYLNYLESKNTIGFLMITDA